VVERPAAGRIFETSRRVRYGDTGPDGRIRLDAVARYLQDVAGDDTSAAGLPGSHAWVVRRALIEVDRWATSWEQLQLATWCGGVGSHWAERVVTLMGADVIDGDGGERSSPGGVRGAEPASAGPASAEPGSEELGAVGASIRTATLWVMIDVATQRPARITPDFTDIYAEATLGRQVGSQLHLPVEPHPDATVLPWQVRRSDLDVLGHMNNAVAWTMLDHAVTHLGLHPRRPAPGQPIRAELEFRQPVLAHDVCELRAHVADGACTVWTLAASSGDVADTSASAPSLRSVARVTV